MNFNPLKNISLTLVQRHGYINIITGVGFIMTGVSKFFDNNIISYTILSIAVLGVMLANIMTFSKVEKDDERSIENYNLAGRNAYFTLLILTLLSNSLFVLTDLNINPQAVTHILAGTGLASFGWNFLKYERG